MRRIKPIKMQKNIALILILIFSPTILLSNNKIKENNKKNINIGIIADKNENSTSEFIKKIDFEINSLINHEKYEVIIKKENIFYENKDENKINGYLKTLEDNKNIDFILSVGMITSDILIKNKKFKKPTIISFIANSKIQGLLNKNNKSNVDNLTYINYNYDIMNDLKKFYTVYHFKKINIIIDQKFKENNQIFIDKLIKNNPQKEKFQIEVIANNNILDKINNMPKNSAIYISDMHNLSKKELKTLIKKLNENKIPFFMGFRKSGNPIAFFKNKKNQIKIARRIALIIDKILSNEKIKEINTKLYLKKELIIDLKASKTLNIEPEWEILADNNIINKSTNGGVKLSLNDAIKESMDKNLDVLIKLEELKISDKKTKKAWNDYLPKIEANLIGALIDEDRAVGSSGMFPQKSIKGKLTLTQVLFAEKINLNVDMNKMLINLNKNKIEEIKQNIALDTAVMYLNVMRTKTFEKMQRENLELSKKHLEIAKTKKRVGTQSVGEIYRWQTQIAFNKKDIIKAEGNRVIAEIALNRLLHRPMESKISTEEITFDSPAFKKQYESIKNHIKNSSDLQNLKNNLVKIGLKNAIELKQLDEVKKIHKRNLKSINRSFFLPTVALQTELSYRFWKETPESEIVMPPGYEAFAPIIAGIFPKTDDLEWSIGINLSFPIFDQYQRFSDKSIAKSEISKIYLQKQSIMTKLEQRIRTMIQKASVSYPSIKLSKDASISANKGLKAVEDAYSKGMVSIIELIDIQNKALIAQKIVINSIYEFIIDLMNVKRAIGISLYSNKGFDKILSDISEKN